MRAADLGVSLPVLPVDRTYDPVYGHAVEVVPGVRRVLARNPNPFTFHGTGTYIVGRGKVAVIDPGPLLDEHVDAILRATAGETITHILVTHTHNDHSPAAAPLRQRTGASTYAFGRHGSGRDHHDTDVEEGGDQDFVPDVFLKDGDRIDVDGLVLQAIHTPGHTSNHLCFSLEQPSILFSGDHVMGWSTTVIAPPDGDMACYFASLDRLLERREELYVPTHGNPIRQPQAFVRQLIAHRHARETQIVACVGRGLVTIPDMVRVIYSEVDSRLHPAAARSVFAHLQHLVRTGRLKASGEATAGATYAVA